MTTVISFTKVKLPFGWLGNMSPHPITYAGQTWKTAEHLFQALRFLNPEIRDEIHAQIGPMQAKFVAKARKDFMVVMPRSELDLVNMRFVLEQKIEQHPELREQLLKTGDATLIEDVSNRPNESGLFWGAARVVSPGVDEWWRGQNQLGKMWMELRASLKPLSE